MKKILLLFLLFIFVSCGESKIEIDFKPVSQTKEEQQYSGIGIDISKMRVEEKLYIPRTYPSIYDTQYMSRVNTMLEQEAAHYSNDEIFKKIIKAIAWKETNWTHYYIDRDANVFLIKGDGDKSFGMFQIYTKYHPELPELIENTKYAVELAWNIYQSVKDKECSSGSNKGEDQEAILRRVYATYNGGSGGTCRNADRRDDGFVDHFYELPWENFL